MCASRYPYGIEFPQIRKISVELGQLIIEAVEVVLTYMTYWWKRDKALGALVKAGADFQSTAKVTSTRRVKSDNCDMRFGADDDI